EAMHSTGYRILKSNLYSATSHADLLDDLEPDAHMPALSVDTLFRLTENLARFLKFPKLGRAHSEPSDSGTQQKRTPAIIAIRREHSGVRATGTRVPIHSRHIAVQLER